jgi:hypothetical protein
LSALCGRSSLYSWRQLSTPDRAYRTDSKAQAVQATIAKNTVERFVVTVLPGASRFDEVRVCRSSFDPLFDSFRRELRAVIALDDRGIAPRFDRKQKRRLARKENSRGLYHRACGTRRDRSKRSGKNQNSASRSGGRCGYDGPLAEPTPQADRWILSEVDHDTFLGPYGWAGNWHLARSALSHNRCHEVPPPSTS